MTPEGYIIAARVPRTLRPQCAGPWTVSRLLASESLASDFVKFGVTAQARLPRDLVGFDDYTLLSRATLSTLHLPYGEIVMEDSKRELRKHLPIWMTARGRVLVTGLGLGCVVRGLLMNPMVTSIDVVEICPHILRLIGPEFERDHRVRLHRGDALKIEWAPTIKFDCAWHDLWTNEDAGEPPLQKLHAKLFLRYRDLARVQGAWAFPRELYRLYAARLPMVGGPKFNGRISA